MTALRELAHVRTGDKGNTCQFSVIAHRIGDFDALKTHLTPDRVAEHFDGLARGAVLRFELPQLGALVFVLRDALSSGVTRSLSLDAHGKCLGMTLLSIDIPLALPAEAGLA